jgi:hypothetical protein
LQKSFWIVPAVLLFAAIGSTNARADSIVETEQVISGVPTWVISGIDNITILGTTYDVSFVNTASPTTTFTNSFADATTAVSDIDNDLNALAGTPNVLITATTTYYVPYLLKVTYFAATGTCEYDNPCLSTETYDFVGTTDIALGQTAAYAEFEPVAATPEPSIFSLMLIGLGLLGAMLLMRKRIARARPQPA